MKQPLPILKDKKMQERLNKDGYVLIDFFDTKELAQLQTIFDELHKNRTDIPYNQLYTCLHNADAEYRWQMNNHLAELCNNRMNDFFAESKNTIFTFQIKGMGPQSELYVHQDWSFTDESKELYTYTFWLPLVESNTGNGTISVLPGSHNYLREIRGANINPVFDHLRKQLIKHLKPLTIRPGQLLLFDSALLHYSPANLSDKIRVSVMTNVMRKEAAVFLYFRNKENPEGVDEYSVPEDFFMHYTNFKEEYSSPPSFAKYERSFVLKEEFYTEPQLEKLVTKIRNDYTFAGRLLNKFYETV